MLGEEQRELWGWAGGEGTLRARPALGQGLEEPFLTCRFSTASNLGSLSPSGSFGKGSL